MNGHREARFIAVILLLGLCALAPARAGETLTTLKQDIFVCVSPEAYDAAMVRVREAGKDLEPLKKELKEAKQCMFVDKEMADDIMAPFAVVMERSGNKVQVQFILSMSKRLAFLHRLVNRYVLVGWTEESNLEPKQIL